MSHGESDALHARVQHFIEHGGCFDALACDIARFQARRVEPVARLWRARGLGDVARAGEIPAMPCDAFRLRRVAAHPPEDDARVFATSGTTLGTRGLHPLRTLATYERGALAWGKAMLFPDLEQAALVLLAEDNPASSLSFMLARFGAALGGDVSWHYNGSALDVDGVRRRCLAAKGAVLVAGTAFAFVHLCDRLAGATLPLPPGSRAMPTGGYKGRSRVVAPAELAAAVARAFALPASHVVAEYGMTELSSQLYQGTLAGGTSGYLPPPWLRIEPVDPETLLPCEGEGLARVVDLANVDSSVAIQTADVIARRDDGSIELLGRAPEATPRGCSLALEHLIEAR
jgi:hypothetical protein